MFDDQENRKAAIILDATSNHGGDIQMAKEMIQSAAQCGADYIKFQSWQASKLAPGNPNYERHKKAELSDDDHFILIEECQKQGIKFLTSCFDVDRVDFLSTLGIDTIKVPSTELSSLRMIKLLSEKFERLILSTGAAYQQEIEEVVDILKGKNFALLHCVSIYPTPLEEMNLARMNWLRQYTPHVGLSDHSLGSVASKMAIAMGAQFIEKHFTIDKSLGGKDQQMSSSPEDVREIVQFRDEFVKILGTSTYEMPPEELTVRKEYIGKWGDNRN